LPAAPRRVNLGNRLNPSASPLTSRPFSDPFCFILNPIASLGLGEKTGVVTTGEFLSHVQWLAARLPDSHQVINICDNRYLFMVAFCAAILREQVNLLPPNKKAGTLKSLLAEYPAAYVLHDGLCSEDARLDSGSVDVVQAEIKSEAWPSFDLSKVLLSADRPLSRVPEIQMERPAAISFTSGSTGDSRPNVKSWRVIVDSSANNARHMLAGHDHETLFQLATVPPQHMWGLETSVMLPLFSSICVADTRPLFPLDIKTALEQLPSPAMLVTTPVHLRALCAVEMSLSPLSLILCATSPLTQALAQQAEEKFATELREIYGCSEIGSMAWRRTASDAPWRLFHGISVAVSKGNKGNGDKEDNEGEVMAATEYLPQPILLQDRWEMLDDHHFHLQGRHSDMLDIAGKRGSLLAINKVLLSYPGLVDGIIFLPVRQQHSQQTKQPKVSRLAGLVELQPGFSIEQLKTFLHEHLDDAFMPRPLLAVDRLPREENGKLSQQRVQALYQQALQSKL